MKPQPISLLFVCLGNICRSPAADAIMRQYVNEARLDDRIKVDSCGIGPWHVGQLPDSRMRRHGARRGYKVDHIARQISQADFRAYTYIIGMDHENMRTLQRLSPREARARLVCLADYLTEHPGQDTVPDPYYGDDADFELALDLIEDGCRELLRRMQEQLTVRLGKPNIPDSKPA